jgi:hypothetical protein
VERGRPDPATEGGDGQSQGASQESVVHAWPKRSGGVEPDRPDVELTRIGSTSQGGARTADWMADNEILNPPKKELGWQSLLEIAVSPLPMAGGPTER